MINFDFAVYDHFDSKTKRIIFRSTRSDMKYYFEFSWKYIKSLINLNFYLLFLPFKTNHIKNL